MYKSGRLERMLLFSGIIISLVIIIMIGFLLRGGMYDEKGTVTYAMYAKMISLAQVSSSTIDNEIMDNHYKNDDEWYVKYLNYMYYKNDFKSSDYKSPKESLTYGDLKELFDNRGIQVESLEDMTGINIRGKKSREKVKFDEFIIIYESIIPYLDVERVASYEEITVCGNYGNNKIVTGENGIYKADGVDADIYKDKKVRAFIKDNELIFVKEVLSDDITYTNVYIKDYNENMLTVFIEGIDRSYKIEALDDIVIGSVADISLQSGNVTKIYLKSDMIEGKVLSVTDEYIEVEKYGKVLLDNNFNVYRTYGDVSMMKKSDILVGYDLQSFYVANGKICAAVIDRTLTASNIRVLLMNTGYASIFHDIVSISSETGYTITYGDKEEHFDSGNLISIDSESRYLAEGRVKIIPDDGGRLIVNSITRSQGTPHYRGSIEIAQTESGLVIINELPLEEYLYSVVPSEMPISYGEEAQKVQAVCARSYAYIQILNNTYSYYGAHVDDSVAYQVYNNINEQDISIRAVNETYGQVLSYNEDVIEAFYYSTSCGYSSDCGIWNNLPEQYPYLSGHSITPANDTRDLTNEENFREFINNPDATAYDYEFAFFRWDALASIGDLSGIVNSNINVRYKASKSSVKTLKSGEFVSIPISTVGTITDIEVTKRQTGGIVSEIKITGTENTVLVSGEYNIRALFGDNTLAINKKNGEKYYATLLPSAFIYFEEVYQDGYLSGYLIKGGGYGHGVGMSQNAVSTMVESMNYREILQFFYNGTSIKQVY